MAGEALASSIVYLSGIGGRDASWVRRVPGNILLTIIAPRTRTCQPGIIAESDMFTG